MDTKFLEFWGNFLIQTAKGQRQLEEMTNWITQGFKGSEDLNTMFKKAYGLDLLNKDSSDYQKIQEKTLEEFQKSFKDYFSQFGLAPREEYLTLAEKYEALKEKVVSQEETIKHLRMLLAAKNSDTENVVNGFQDLLKKQGDQFQQFMENASMFFQKKSS